MGHEIDERMKELGIELPEPSAPGANYVPFLREGKLPFITGQLSQWNGERRYIGQVGQAFDLEEGRAAARLAASTSWLTCARPSTATSGEWCSASVLPST